MLKLSATTGEGMDAWLHWLGHAVAERETAARHHQEHGRDASQSDTETALRQRIAELEAALAQQAGQAVTRQ